LVLAFHALAIEGIEAKLESKIYKKFRVLLFQEKKLLGFKYLSKKMHERNIDREVQGL
jgi:hypothetical protein